MPRSPKFSKDFDGKAYSDVLKVFDICLKSPNDSEEYFGFVVYEFSELVHTGKSLFCGLTRQQKHRICTKFLTFLGVFEDCLELPSNSKDPFAFLVGEFSEL